MDIEEKLRSDYRLPTYNSISDFENNYKIDYTQFEKEYTLPFFLKGCVIRSRLKLGSEGLYFGDDGEVSFVNKSSNDILKTVKRMGEVIDVLLFSELKENVNKVERNSKEIDNSSFSEEIQSIANVVFSYNHKNIHHLKFIAERFTGYRKDFTELTKYNQIFFFFNSITPVPKEPYKNLIKEMFGFDYGDSEIKGINEKHQSSIQRIVTSFRPE